MLLYLSMGKTSIEILNEELIVNGMEELKDVDPCIERTRYIGFLMSADLGKKEDIKRLASLKIAYLLQFHTRIASVYPYLLFEQGEDKIYWNYNHETGVYDEMNFSTVRGLILKLLIDDEMTDKATEVTAKTVLARYRSIYKNRGVLYKQFDNNDNWFHCKNGWINVVTMVFEAHTPERLSRRVSHVNYNKEATCPVYNNFLDTQIQLPTDQVRVIDQFSGLLLTPDITKQKMLVLVGNPGCGKSTLLDLWSDVLGECSTQRGLNEINSESFRFGGSSLAGKTLCWFDEVEVTRSNMGNSLIKLITGQHIDVERKGINGITQYPNQLKCVLTANTLPRSAEMGIYRRMILIYLTYSFYDNLTDNKKIRKMLQDESSGVFNRMLKGLQDLNKNSGFTSIEGHDDLVEEYKTDSNTVAEFLDTHFVFDYEAPKISVRTILEAYKIFADDKFSNSLTPQKFSSMMKRHGLKKFDKISVVRGSAGIRMWIGLKLKTEFELNQNGFIREKKDF